MQALTRKYPVMEINLTKLRHNIDEMVGRCNAAGIEVTGVIKGFNGVPEAARMFSESACIGLATSRLEQVLGCMEAGIKGPYMLIRIPMPGEVEDVVRYTESSLESELATIRLLDAECARQHKRHGVILMADLGDLREGWWDKDEMADAAVQVEAMENIDLLGVGTNLGCYGSVLATETNLGELVSIAERIEARIGRRLKYISGGATTSLPLVLNGTMPKRVNHLRVGEGILQGKDLNDLWNIPMDFLDLDVFTLKAEVIEVKRKPSYPVGEIFVDCFGGRGEYTDRGMRKRALCGIGKLDFVFCDMLIPKTPGIEVLGGSSDHLILDVEDCRTEPKPGDVLEFDVRYATMAYVTASRYVRIECVK